ncbi:MAG: cytochrome c [Deltaproteobacteria bacterium]|nr:MAG: cytochrome c [Deltaproteobacteria bacterium]
MRGAAVVLLAAAAASVAAADVGGPALDYALNCQGCHRADGAGTPGSVPALAGSVGKFLRVPGGREYLIRVPGVAQAPLDDAATAAVLNWILARFGNDDLPADFSPYTPAEIGRLRRDPLTDVERVRRDLLDAIARSK